MARDLPTSFPDIEISRVRTGRLIRVVDWEKFPKAAHWLWARRVSLMPGRLWRPHPFRRTSGLSSLNNEDANGTDFGGGPGPGSADAYGTELFKPKRVLASGSYRVEILLYLIDMQVQVAASPTASGTATSSTVSSNLGGSGEWVRTTLTLDSGDPWILYINDTQNLEATGDLLQWGAREDITGVTASEIPSS